tara:strand:+ start:12652 stop:13137 length:486 start_codon:yes stop_codon:yes gene_type:complete
MPFEYQKNAANSKILQAKKQPGLSKDITLDFSSIHIRVYKSEGYQGYFNCSLAIPSYQDDEGYVFEFPFSDVNESKLTDIEQEADSDSLIEGIEFGESFESNYRYDVQLHEHSFDSVINAMVCKFEDKIEQGRRILSFNLSIKGTPFNGYVLIDEDFYNCN